MYFCERFAKLKTNIYTGVTLGFKNAMGAIPYALRERNHNYYINKKLADLLYLFKPDLVIIDGIIGGEGNGGVIYPELHYGRDALVGTALFLTYFAGKNMTMTALKATYPQYAASKNKIELTPAIDVDKVLLEMKSRYASENVNDIDGVKIDFAEGWVHLRKSNTEPIIRVYSEAATMDKANALAQQVMAIINE